MNGVVMRLNDERTYEGKCDEGDLEVFFKVESVRILLSSIAFISFDVFFPCNTSLGVFSDLLLEEV